MSVLVIILIVLVVLVVLFLAGGIAGARKRDRAQGGAYAEHVAAADRALEQARADDKGWHRDALEAAVRAGVAQQRPDFSVDSLQLVLVDDRPGVTEDRAQFVAAGPGGELRVVLGRREGGDWRVETLE